MKSTNDFPFIPASKAFNRILNMVDDTFLLYEEQIQKLELEKEEYRNLYNELMNKQLADGNKMMGDVLLACFDKASLDIANAPSAIVLLKLSEMQTIEEVHEYINEMRQASIIKLQDQNDGKE